MTDSRSKCRFYSHFDIDHEIKYTTTLIKYIAIIVKYTTTPQGNRKIYNNTCQKYGVNCKNTASFIVIVLFIDNCIFVTSDIFIINSRTKYIYYISTTKYNNLVYIVHT